MQRDQIFKLKKSKILIFLNSRHFWFHFQTFYPSQQVNQWISYRIPGSAIHLLLRFPRSFIYNFFVNRLGIFGLIKRKYLSIFPRHWCSETPGVKAHHQIRNTDTIWRRKLYQVAYLLCAIPNWSLISSTRWRMAIIYRLPTPSVTFTSAIFWVKMVDPSIWSYPNTSCIASLFTGPVGSISNR